MSPFFQPYSSRYGGHLTVASPYAQSVPADATTDVAILPGSGSTGYRGARSAYGRDFSPLEAVLVAWRRGVAGLPGVRFLPQSNLSRGIQFAPDMEAAWDWVYVPREQVRTARDLAYRVGMDSGFQANVAETGYWDGTGSWLLMTWGRGGPATWSAMNHARIREGEQRIQGLSASRYGVEGEGAYGVRTAASRQAGIARAFNLDGVARVQAAFMAWSRGMVPNFLEGYVFNSNVSGSEARALAQQFLSQRVSVPGRNQVDANAWTEMTVAQKTDFLDQAIRDSIVSNHVDAGLALERAWSGIRYAEGFEAKLRSAARGWVSGAKEFWTDRAWRGLKGIIPGTELQTWNGTAFAYWLGHKVPATDVYPTLLAQIDREMTASRYGAEDVEVGLGALSYKGDAETAIVLALIGAACALRGG